MTVVLELKEDQRKKYIKRRIERKNLFIREKRYIPHMVNTWLIMGTFACIMNNIKKAYIYQKHYKKRAKMFMSIFLAFAFIGKLLRRLRMRKGHELIRLLKNLISVRKPIWKFGRLVKAKKTLAKFLMNNKLKSNIMFLIKLTTCKIIKIQRWYKWCYAKKKLMYGIMLREWSIIEYILLNTKSNELEKKIDYIINVSIQNNKVSNVIPKKTRLNLITKCLYVFLNLF